MQKILTHDQLGEVQVKFKPNARHFIARWGTNGVDLTAPSMASDTDVLSALDRLAPRLLSAGAPEVVRYHDCQSIKLDGLEIGVISCSIYPGKIIVSQRDPEFALVSVGTDYDFDDDVTSRLISKALKSLARKNAARILLPHAKELAARLGCRPSGWQISSGCRVLGQCDGAGVIKLSYMNVFLPAELRDYVICHELAHLSELNHSERFHRLCDTYLGGREKELVDKLKTYEWPLERKI